jgi:hypothetical protein
MCFDSLGKTGGATGRAASYKTGRLSEDQHWVAVTYNRKCKPRICAGAKIQKILPNPAVMKCGFRLKFALPQMGSANSLLKSNDGSSAARTMLIFAGLGCGVPEEPSLERLIHSFAT